MSVFKDSATYRPFTYPWAMEMAIEHNVALYWDTHQVDLADDIRQFHGAGGLATENVSHEVNQYILTKTLNVFTQMDVAAGSVYCLLLPHVKNNEIRNMWMNFAARESVHQRAYAMAVEELGFPDSTWGEFMEYKEMQDKIDLMTNVEGRDLSNKLDFAITVAQLLLAEGICLFGAFACMLNLKRFGLMMGTNLINEWSLRDEEKHVLGNMKVLMEVRKELSEADKARLDKAIVDIAEMYAEAEYAYIDLVFAKGDQEGMTAQDMKKYIRYLTDLRIYNIGLGKAPTDNPLEWMDWVLSGQQHTNFFEQKVTEYDHTGLTGDIDYSQYKSLIPTK